MKKYFPLIFKSLRSISRYVTKKLHYIVCRIILYGNGVDCKRIVTYGIPFVSIAQKGKCEIGDNFIIINNIRGNPIGRVNKCVLFVDNGAEIVIGNNVGMSATALVARTSIRIGDNVKIGGGVCIYDTDFHSLDPEMRKDIVLDVRNTNNKPVVIGDNVFIGAHSTILKGVTIGNNSIIGACAVVTRNIPENEIWGGNPAKFIKKIIIKNE